MQTGESSIPKLNQLACFREMELKHNNDSIRFHQTQTSVKDEPHG